MKLWSWAVSAGRIERVCAAVKISLVPLSLLSVSQCGAGCCRPCRGDLLPCCTLLCWWGRRVRCQGHLSDKQSRCLTLTNSPAGLGQPPRHSSAATSTQSAETCCCCTGDRVSLPVTTTAARPAAHGSLLFISLWWLLPPSPAALEIHDGVSGPGWKAPLNMRPVFFTTKGLLSEAYSDIKVKLFMHCRL